ncbi:MAG: hypothetical protein IVW36_09020 [Dehalococcoidia bacterium]|nr:hypothetical protein [Dehalococcoidia bacterium]
MCAANRSMMRRYSLAALLVVAAAVLAGCARGTSTGAQRTAARTATGSAQAARPTASSPAGASSPAAGTSAVAAVPTAAPCAPAKPYAAGSSDVRTPDGRHYVLYVPPGYDGRQALPVVINLHGAGSNAAQQAFYSGFQRKAAQENFITITPDALGTPQAWNFIPLPDGADDVGFIRRALDATEAALCVDPARVYATGISSGAAMSVRLACSLQDRIAAIGIVAALWYPPGCPMAKAMPVLEFHGTADPLVPFAGGTVANSGLPAPAIEDAAAAWARADGCASEPARARFANHVRSVAYSECRDDIAVVLFVVEGGGHTWPGAPVDIAALGPTTQEINATDQIWQFFVAQAMSATRR